jgi:tetratricopeptide (TPR) repeat protein
MKSLRLFQIGFLIFLSLGMLPIIASAQNSRRPVLKRDTDISEGKEEAKSSAVKEPNPILSAQNISIGNQYLKSKNYAAAIDRYLEALSYDLKSVSAHEALARAYEKNGDTTKAIQALKALIEQHPESPKAAKYRIRIAQLEKKIR